MDDNERSSDSKRDTDLIALRDAAPLVAWPRPGGPAYQTLHSWAWRGRRTAGGRRLRLRTRRVGRRRFTSRAWLAEFLSQAHTLTPNPERPLRPGGAG